jgi:hypothetical protein
VAAKKIYLLLLTDVTFHNLFLVHAKCYKTIVVGGFDNLSVLNFDAY